MTVTSSSSHNSGMLILHLAISVTVVFALNCSFKIVTMSEQDGVDPELIECILCVCAQPPLGE